MRNFINDFHFAIALLDFEGCGREGLGHGKVEQNIENNLKSNGWDERAQAIAINPEIENWVWVNEVKLKDAISWKCGSGIYEWLHEKGLKQQGKPKPTDPKKSFELLLEESRLPRSSSIYYKIAKNASYRKCRDVSFLKLLHTLREWFPLP